MTQTGTDATDVSLEELSRSVTRTGGKYLCGLLQCSLADREQVATGDLAEYLDVSRASVTEMVEKFGDGDLVDHEHYKGTTLTNTGETLARHLQWRRCVTEQFFETELDLDVDVDNAYRIGFELPDAGANRLAELVDHPCDRTCQATEPDECANLTIGSA
ncbi:metal-dependent transcriptional regulator [Halorhabdus sp. BNX81]|uniref:metal-dependent transcriptional regulator n=1 Tax=Halorhabdus sp. BNX81 TaxID=2980181 RepID=UPI0023DCFD6E|nr:metal-dependent transcriptional regulator [Halorhabdus sp. BNX81]WEL22534.1 DtxR family transcriptional regulator, Mn-dependent transcriptional regulator [Halorhabdus sp. BNX81]